MKWLNSKKRIIPALIILFLATYAIGSLAGGPIKKLFSESIVEKSAEGKTINILFMGIDDRENKSNSRSDTMILASIDSKTNKMVMVSVPRDTHIKNTLGQSEKINSVNYIKGPEAACSQVGELLGVPVDYYVVTNFAGFGNIVDVLGGVDLDVETSMVHKDVSYSINLSKGYQHLNGSQALQYVRYRGGPTADIGRTQRQQKFIKALAKQMFKANTILKLPELVPQISKYVKTNIPASDMLYLAKLAKNIDISKINAQTLPGYPYTDPSSGASYWEVDKAKAKIVIATLMQGKTFDVVGDEPEWMKATPAKYKSKELPTPEVLQTQPEVTTTDPTTDPTAGSSTGSTTQPETGGTSPDTGSNTSVPNNGDTTTANPTVPNGTIEDLPANSTDSAPAENSSTENNTVINNGSNTNTQP